MASGSVRGLGGMVGEGAPSHSSIALAGLENSPTGFSLPFPHAIVRIALITVKEAMVHRQAIQGTKRGNLPAIIVTSAFVVNTVVTSSP